LSEEITFKYKFTEDYNPKYVNGAYGGIGPRGELIVNFYLERQPIPKKESHAIDQEGGVQELISRTPENINQQIIRFVETGIVLNYESGKRIYEWLGKHLQTLEQLTENDKDE
jgi:hypothetical protein